MNESFRYFLHAGILELNLKTRLTSGFSGWQLPNIIADAGLGS
jgi:hypothetical protein